MDWKLILQLSLFGLLMAIATVFIIPSNIEPFFWLVIFLVCAYIIAKKRSDKHFLHGLFVSIVNSVWITAAHVLFYDRYLAIHPKEAAMLNSMPTTASGKMMMLIMGPLIGVVSGLALGLFSFIAGKLIRPTAAAGMEQRQT